jgi:hypothetical protein
MEHDVEELATIVIRSFAPVVVTDEVRRHVERLHRDGVLAPPVDLDPSGAASPLPFCSREEDRE